MIVVTSQECERDHTFLLVGHGFSDPRFDETKVASGPRSNTESCPGRSSTTGADQVIMAAILDNAVIVTLGFVY